MPIIRNMRHKKSLPLLEFAVPREFSIFSSRESLNCGSLRDSTALDSMNFRGSDGFPSTNFPANKSLSSSSSAFNANGSDRKERIEIKIFI